MNGPSDPVELSDYDPCWAAAFEDEKRRLSAIFDGEAVGIEHVGSTSVPKLSAKAILQGEAVVRLREL